MKTLLISLGKIRVVIEWIELALLSCKSLKLNQVLVVRSFIPNVEVKKVLVAYTSTWINLLLF
jgi:hypothetical protein